MSALRVTLRAHPGLAALVLVAALMLRVLVPAGYMPATDGNGFAITICTGASPPPVAAMAMAGMAHHDDDTAMPETSCAFAALSLSVLGGADSVLLTDAVIYVIATGLLPTPRSPISAARHVRPPLRGPPHTAM